MSDEEEMEVDEGVNGGEKEKGETIEMTTEMWAEKIANGDEVGDGKGVMEIV